jgi:hypothetical protein
VAVEKLKRYISPGIDQIPAESIEQGVEKCSEIHKLINSIWIKELPEKWKIRSSYLIIRTMVKTDYSSYRSISLFPTTYKILSIKFCPV